MTRTAVSFDYTRVDWSFVHRIMSENNRRLSRTHKGHSDTGSSDDKRPLLLSGPALRAQIERNAEEVGKFVHAQGVSLHPRSAREVRSILFQVADLTNQGTLPQGRFRTWPIAANQPPLTGGPTISGPDAKVSPDSIESELDDFCAGVWHRWPEISSDPVPLAAWAEWELNAGPLHPFYDGCGRISRYFAAALLVRGSCLIPLFENSTSYFFHANQGRDHFEVYFRSRIEDSVTLLRGMLSETRTSVDHESSG